MSCALLSEVVVGAISQTVLPLLPPSPAPIFLVSSLLKSHRDTFMPRRWRQGTACKVAPCLHALALTSITLWEAALAFPGLFLPLCDPVPASLSPRSSPPPPCSLPFSLF